MNLSKLNDWLTLVANIGVFLGIIFLAIEIRQNSNMIASQTRDSVTEKNVMVALSFATTDDETAEVIARGSRGELENGPNRDWIRFVTSVQANLRIWENEYYQYQRGLFDEFEFEPRRETWRFSMQRVGYRQVWEVVRMQFSPGFRDEMDTVVREQMGRDQSRNSE